MNDHLAIAIVADFKYLRKYFSKFLNQLRNIGNYSGTIIIITSLFTPTFFVSSTLKDKKIKIIRCRKIKFTKKTEQILNTLYTGSEPNRNKTKKFQWHKFNLFDTRLKNWNHIFYLDLNMNIHYDINPILKNKPIKKLFARSDSYPEFERKLSSQFDNKNKIYKDLEKNFNLDITDYFQTGILFFDTEIITNNTKDELIDLTIKYPISITNEQGIMNLYFNHIKKDFEQLPFKFGEMEAYFYWLVDGEKIIITKQDRVKYK